MRRNRKAKIIVTLGPTSSDSKSIRKLFASGADVFRLNFSHDIASAHTKRFKEISKRFGDIAIIPKKLTGYTSLERAIFNEKKLKNVLICLRFVLDVNYFKNLIKEIKNNPIILNEYFL